MDHKEPQPQIQGTAIPFAPPPPLIKIGSEVEDFKHTSLSASLIVVFIFSIILAMVFK